MRDGKGTAADDDRRPGLFDAAPAVHDRHDPEQHDDGQEGQLPTGHLADLERVQPGHLPGHDDRDPHGTEGHRGGIGDQAQTGGIKRLEAQPDQQRRRDRDRGAKARRALEKGAEGEAHQDHLQTLVLGH